MLLTFQFPIADARGFSSHTDLRLPVPDWPEPDTDIDPQFVHYFGKACERTKEPDEAWPDENKFVLARRGLRFCCLERHHSGFSGNRFRSRCAFRRLFNDGQAVVRVEIGIAHNDKLYLLDNLTPEALLTIARELAEIPTVVTSIAGISRQRPILAQGKSLALLYANASMNKATTKQTLGLRLVESANPLIIMELKQHEASLDPRILTTKGFFVLDPSSVNGAIAVFCRLKTNTGIVSTWILQKGSATDDQLRSLRICLTRLHAEREVLDIILKQIHRGYLLNPPNENAVNLLDEYFNQRIKIVNRDIWGGMKQSAIITAFDATQAVIRPAVQSQLLTRYKGGRRQVWEKIRSYQEQRQAIRVVTFLNIEAGGTMIEKQINISGTGNIVNVAEYMSNVTNTVNNNLSESNATNEVKELIQQLNKEIEQVAPEADPAQVKKMGKNLEVLSKEIASEDPEPRWYEVSLEGIKEAAKAVGEVAEPIIKIAAKIAALLL